MANSLTIETLDVRKGELLMLHFHRKSGNWWATVGDANSMGIREGAEGATPAAALFELCLLIGGTVTGAN